MERADGQLLALHAALRKLINDPTATCRWLDASGAFQPKRAAAILDQMGIEVRLIGAFSNSRIRQTFWIALLFRHASEQILTCLKL